MIRIPPSERGAALLSVLLLVAVMAAVAATALDRIGVGTRLAGNAATIWQARAWLGSVERMTLARLEDLQAASTNQAGAGDLLGATRQITLPDGGTVNVRLDDGANCFNLNSLVQLQEGAFVVRPVAVHQFAALMTAIGVAEGEAATIAAATVDYVDSDGVPVANGREDGPDEAIIPANRPMAHPTELRLVASVEDRHFRLLERWICALPVTELSPINVNTLLPEQAPLVAMLAPGRLDLRRARAQIAARPSGGYASVVQFWNSPVLQGLQVPGEAAEQVKISTAFYVMTATVRAGGLEVGQRALLDARAVPAKLVYREWTAS